MKKGIDYIGVGAGAVIVNSENRFFLAKRGKLARNERHKWEFPGGAVEFGERLEDCLVREVKKEYGFLYESGTPRLLEPDKCDEIGWFSLEEIPEQQLTIASKKSLESLRKKKI